jgi:hypothetical protein
MERVYYNYFNFLCLIILIRSFITRNKQHRVGVDAYNVKGDKNDTFLTDHNLNVSHRTTYDDVERYPT